MRVGTIKTLIIDQLQNIYYLWQLVISVYFVDQGDLSLIKVEVIKRRYLTRADNVFQRVGWKEISLP